MNALLKPAAAQADHHALAHVAERLGGAVTRLLMTISDHQCDIATSSCATTYSEWQRASASTFAYRLASCAMLVAVDEELAGAFLERQFGGLHKQPSGRTPGQCRATASLARDLASGVAHAIADAWPGANPAEIIASSEVAQFARADDKIATLTLTLADGEIRVAFAVEGLVRIAGAPVPPPIADWAARLRASAMSSRLPVRAVLARPHFPASTIMRLSVGDVLPIPRPLSVPLYAGARRVARGVLTETDGRTALQIQMMETLTHD